ncbi:TSUP family transporter [Marinomonas transparens]|uniref:Probable membrane transporter protein n=1 Tax=Marinomonas transparens TaxID=2795388 RepID=A0A934JRW8_9GAMM|nr:TSUP family transporter [Marinomonas transparens]MBJ7538743.1 TSUP family transporter [Marinomonas transparens]
MTEFAFNLDSHVLLFLFLVAICAGVVDAIAGGGGLITIPSLLIAGVPPILTLGTNRLQAVIGEATAFITFLFHNQIQAKGLLTGIVFTAVGALIGSYSVSLFDKHTLEILLPILMVCITLYAIFSKRIKGSEATTAKISNRSFMITCGLLIGFYNGFFGPGTGSIWMLAFVILLGFTIKQASIMTKPLNLMGNLVSLFFFIGIASVDYRIGLAMGAGQVIGSYIGSKFVIAKGDKIVRPVFIAVTLLMTSKLIYEKFSLENISTALSSVQSYFA